MKVEELMAMDYFFKNEEKQKIGRQIREDARRGVNVNAPGYFDIAIQRAGFDRDDLTDDDINAIVAEAERR